MDIALQSPGASLPAPLSRPPLNGSIVGRTGRATTKAFFEWNFDAQAK